MKKIILATLVAFMVTGVQAQIVSSKNSRLTVEKQAKVKPEIANYNRISFGLSTMKLRDTYYDKSDREVFDFDDESITLKGIDINYLRGISLTQKFPLYLEVGGRMTFDTDNESYSDYDAHINMLSLSVPVNVTYKYTFSNGFYLAPFVGIHFRTNLFGKVKYEDTDGYDYEKEEYKYNIFKADDDDDDAYFDDDEDPAKRFQFGGQVGLNFGYKALNIGFAYYFDTPLYKYESKTNSMYDYKYKSGGVALTVGVNF